MDIAPRREFGKAAGQRYPAQAELGRGTPVSVWHHWRSGSYQFAALFFLAVMLAAILGTGGNCALRKFPIQFLSRNCREPGTANLLKPRQKRFTEFRLNLRGPTSPFAAGIPVANQLF
jgi:hypothetical protein